MPQEPSSRLQRMKAEFQQKQLLEKERKLLQLYNQQQQRACQVVQRGSAGSNGSNKGSRVETTITATPTRTTTYMTTTTQQGGKVRQMFDERRQGIDRSYPLDPLESLPRETLDMSTGRNKTTKGQEFVVMENGKGGKIAIPYNKIHGFFEPDVFVDEAGVSWVRKAVLRDDYPSSLFNTTSMNIETEAMKRDRMTTSLQQMGLNATAKTNNVPQRSPGTTRKVPSKQMAKSNSQGSKIAGTSPIRSGSSWTSEYGRRNLEDAKNPQPARSGTIDRFYVADAMSKKRNESSDIETCGRRDSSLSSWIKTEGTGATWTIYPGSFKSLTSDGKIFLRRKAGSTPFLYRESAKSVTPTSTGRKSIDYRSASSDREKFVWRSTSPEFFRRGSDHSATSMSIDRKSTGSRSASSDREKFMWRSTSPDFFCREGDRSATTMKIDRKGIGSRSISSDRDKFTRRSTSPEFFCKEGERSATTMKIDRKDTGSKSASFDRQKTFTRRSKSPEFFCKEGERSATTMSIDRGTDGSKSLEWEMYKKWRSPFFHSESQPSRGTSESESPMSGRKTSLRETPKRRDTNPQFFCKLSERSGTTMNIDRKSNEVSRSTSYNRETATKRDESPQFSSRGSQRPASIDRKYSGFKRGARTSSPQFFCRESEKSGTTTLIEPRISSTKNIWKQRNYTLDVSHKRPIRPLLSTVKKIRPTTQDRRRAPTPSFARHEVEKDLREKRISSAALEARGRSYNISETPATSTSSIVSLKYGLEFDNIFQSAGPVRKFVKSQNGERGRRLLRRNGKDVRNNRQSRNRFETPSPLLPKPRPLSADSGKSVTLSTISKSITPTEADVDIQEMTVTDHRLERDNKLRKVFGPTPKDRRTVFGGTYTRSLAINGRKFRASLTYPVRKAYKPRASTLESSIFERDFIARSETFAEGDRRGDRDGDSSVVSPLGRLSRSPTPRKRTARFSRTAFSASPGGKRYAADTISSMLRSRGKRAVPNRSRSLSYERYSRELELTSGDDDTGLDEVDAGQIDSKYRATVLSALNKEAKVYREIARPSSADRAGCTKDGFLPERTMTTITTRKGTISTPPRPIGAAGWRIKSVATRDSRIPGREIRFTSESATRTKSKQGSTQRRSPKCRVRLFESDSEKENAARGMRSPEDLDCGIARRSRRTKGAAPTISVKALRSIEDIRKSIDFGPSKLSVTRWSAIANRRTDGAVAIDATTKVKSRVSRITRNSSLEATARKQREASSRPRATGGSTPPPSYKNSDIVLQRGSTETKNQDAKPSPTSSAIARRGAESIGNRTTKTGAAEVVNSTVLQNESSGSYRLSDDPNGSANYEPSGRNVMPPKKQTAAEKSRSNKPQATKSASGRSGSSSFSGIKSTQNQARGTKDRMSKTSTFNEPQTPINLKDLVECDICKRQFAKNRINVHEKICEKVKVKERKMFDMTKVRARGTELESFSKKTDSKRSREAKKSTPKLDWRKVHNDFIETIRYAKEVQAHVAAGGNLKDMRPPPTSDTSDYIQCPHCGRKFNQAAAERHIPKCKNMQHNKPREQTRKSRR